MMNTYLKNQKNLFAKLFITSCTILSFVFVSTQQLNAQIFKRFNKTEQQESAHPFSGKIIFAQEKGSYNVDETTMTDSIRFDQYLSFKGFFPKAPYELVGLSEEKAYNVSYRFNFYLNGELISSSEKPCAMTGGKELEVKGRFYEYPEYKYRLQYGLPELGECEYLKMMEESYQLFTPGSHKFRVEIIPFNELNNEEGASISSNELILTIPRAETDNPDHCLPVAIKNPQEMDNLVEKYISQISNDLENGDVSQVIITRGWEIERNSVTGIIIRRGFSFSLAYKVKGNCRMISGFAYQDHNGSKFDESSTSLRINGNSFLIPCGCMTKE